ncbi:hypothetical protein ACVXHA_21565 [Escherichia coli]
MITRFGMDEGLGYIAFEAQRPRFLDTPELAHGGCRVAEIDPGAHRIRLSATS